MRTGSQAKGLIPKDIEATALDWRKVRKNNPKLISRSFRSEKGPGDWNRGRYMRELTEVDAPQSLSALVPDKAKSVFVPILLALALSLAAIVVLLLFTARTLDQREHLGTLRSVQTAMTVEADRLQQVARDTSWWDEAIARLLIDPDADWADDNIGSYLHDAFNLDLSLVLNGDDRYGFVYLDGKEAMLREDRAFAQGAALLAGQARRAAGESPIPVSGYLTYRGTPYLVAVSAFVYEDALGHSTGGAALLLGKRLDDELVGHLGKLFRIPGLHLRKPGESVPETEITLTNPAGTTVATLSWNKPAAAWSALTGLLAPLALVVLTVVGLTWRFLSVELEQRRRNQAVLARLATTDALTGISNRRFFLERADQEIERCRRFTRPATVLMLDIDHFKGINDNYGHAAGDDTLKSLTNLVSGILRQVDLFGRLGGEEFVILMPETSPQAAGEAAERIRQTVADTPVDTSEGRIVFTVSIGVSEFQKQDKDVHDLLARADQALYAAKESGRNRVLQWLPQNGPDIGQIGPP